MPKVAFASVNSRAIMTLSPMLSKRKGLDFCTRVQNSPFEKLKVFKKMLHGLNQEKFLSLFRTGISAPKPDLYRNIRLLLTERQREFSISLPTPKWLGLQMLHSGLGGIWPLLQTGFWILFYLLKIPLEDSGGQRQTGLLIYL